MDDKRHLSSLRRGLSALCLLNIHGRVTTGQLAKHCRVPRTTAHRILATLVDEGYVHHDPSSHAYTLTAQVRRLTSGFGRDGLVSEVGRPVLDRLCRKLMMPCGLATPVGLDMVLQVVTDSDAPLALGRLPEGTAFPITYGASGHVYLAHCTAQKRKQLIALAQMSSGSFVDLYQPPIPDDEALDEIRRRGYAFNPGAEPGCREGLLAVPIHFNGAYIASLTLRIMNRVLSLDMVLQRHLGPLERAAREIERGLHRRGVDSDALSAPRADRPLMENHALV